MKQFRTIVQAVLASGFKIWIYSSFGGKSHIARMLEIGKELHFRGHNVTYLASSDNMVFSENMPFESLDLGNAGLYFQLKRMAQGELMQERNTLQLTFDRVHQKVLTACYKAEYPKLNRVLFSPPDLMICDAIAYACQDLARSRAIPLMISTQAYEPDLINPVALKQVRIDSFNGDYGMIVSTSYLGIEPAMKSLPTMRFLGPLPTLIPALDKVSSRFLNSHAKVAYVGFGSLMVLRKDEIGRILDALQEIIDMGLLDGVIWGAGATSLLSFPSHINVNGTQLPLSDLQHIKILTWANQLPILNHPHTKLIITHAGLESTMEAIVSQTPALAFPLVFDQPKNAKRIVQLGIGRAIKISSIKQVIADNIKQILTTDKIKINLAKIHAVATSDANSLDSAANFILAYTNLATRCRRIMKFNPKDNLPPCELAHLIPAPEFKYRPELKMIFAASTAILLYLLTMRLLAAYVKVGKHKKME